MCDFTFEANSFILLAQHKYSNKVISHELKEKGVKCFL
jgi:hypothetical protein